MSHTYPKIPGIPRTVAPGGEYCLYDLGGGWMSEDTYVYTCRAMVTREWPQVSQIEARGLSYESTGHVSGPWRLAPQPDPNAQPLRLMLPPDVALKVQRINRALEGAYAP